jgi:hypothetical protein
MTQIRKENDELRKAEENEQLINDCAYIQTIKDNIRNTSINRLEELRIEFIKTNNIYREEQVIVNRIFKFLKEKA